VLLAVSERKKHLKFGGGQRGRSLCHSLDDISSVDIVNGASGGQRVWKHTEKQ
jgi:hypothetical protein